MCCRSSQAIQLCFDRTPEKILRRVSLLRIAILGSGKGSNCRAILDRFGVGKLQAEARIVISDVFDAGILDIAREFGIPNVYLTPGPFRTRLSPESEANLVQLLREAAGGTRSAGRFHACAEVAHAGSFSGTDH